MKFSCFKKVPSRVMDMHKSSMHSVTGFLIMKIVYEFPVIMQLLRLLSK